MKSSIRIFLFFAFSLPLIYPLAHETHARPAVLPVQQLHLELGSSGPTIHALFGRFPASKTGGCPAPSYPVKQGTSPLLTCKGVQCPAGASPDPYGAQCNPFLISKPVHACPANKSCTNWSCQSTSQSRCCGVCIWDFGTCFDCTTSDNGCNGK
jgi:hypothetical protein